MCFGRCSDRRRRPNSLQPCNLRLGGAESGRHNRSRDPYRCTCRHHHLNQSELFVSPRTLLAERWSLQEALSQFLQLRHVLSVYIRSVAVANTSRGRPTPDLGEQVQHHNTPPCRGYVSAQGRCRLGTWPATPSAFAPSAGHVARGPSRRATRWNICGRRINRPPTRPPRRMHPSFGTWSSAARPVARPRALPSPPARPPRRRRGGRRQR